MRRNRFSSLRSSILNHIHAFDLFKDVARSTCITIWWICVGVPDLENMELSVLARILDFAHQVLKLEDEARRRLHPSCFTCCKHSRISKWIYSCSFLDKHLSVNGTSKKDDLSLPKCLWDCVFDWARVGWIWSLLFSWRTILLIFFLVSRGQF